MWAARWKLISLWISQISRVTADNALRFFVCLNYAERGEQYLNSAWYLVTAIFMAPAVFLAPLNGALSNTLPKATVLKGAALAGFAAVLAFAVADTLGADKGIWIWAWALIAVTWALYGPTRTAMLPASSIDSHWPLTRINGLFEMGAAGATITGMIFILGTSARTSELETVVPINQAILVIVALHLSTAMFALPVVFPSDLRREDSPWEAIRGFFVDCVKIWKEREARVCLFGLSGLRGLVIAMTGALLPRLLHDADFFKKSAFLAAWVAGGMALGSLLAGAQRHPRRVLGFVPWAGLGLSMGLIWAASGDIPGDGMCMLFGVLAGLVNVPLATTYQIALPPDARGNGMAVRNMNDYLITTVVAGTLFLAVHFRLLSPLDQMYMIAAIAIVATIASAWIFRREVVEQLLEVVFLFMYRFRCVGPGVDSFPLRGPVIVVANHSSWMDPMWLAKVLPRSVIPMMTSVFFDHWLLRWMMVYIADAIRVEASTFRREVPELQTAVAALAAGKCLVIFPEGRLRRSEEQPLRLFGQGVWRILCERADTPVVVCWIEGGWGSFFSYWNGLPTKNKRFDILRPLGIAVGEPRILSKEMLDDQLKTRQYLMEQCGKMRSYLGLPAVQVQRTDQETA